MKPGGWTDHVGKGLALAGQSVPSFWLAILLVLFFSVRLDWFPPFGQGGWEHLVLPAIALGAFSLASLVRLSRSAILEVMRKDHTLFMNAKGVSPRLLVVHTLRNASLPIVTLAGILLGTLISASVIVETIFAWPGVGQLAIQGINSRDYNVVQGVVLVNTAIFVVLLFIVDVSYGLLDPRVRRIGRVLPVPLDAVTERRSTPPPRIVGPVSRGADADGHGSPGRSSRCSSSPASSPRTSRRTRRTRSTSPPRCSLPSGSAARGAMRWGPTISAATSCRA